jgi:hypothetical protein
MEMTEPSVTGSLVLRYDTAIHFPSNSLGRRSGSPLRNRVKTTHLSQVRDSAETLLLRQTRNWIRTHDVTEVRKWR